MPRAKFRPAVTRLEPRELLATAVSNLVASPSVLTPPNNGFVRVVVTGNVVENRVKVLPNVDFTVVDEYRRYEPSGKIKLKKLTPTVYSFEFTVTLQAKRSSQDTAGRQYYVIVGTSDLDNSQGLIVPVLVPYNKLKPGQTIPRMSDQVKTAKKH